MLYYIMFYFFFFLGLFLFFTGLLFIYMDYILFIDWEILSLFSSVISFSMLFDFMSLMFLGSVMIISSMVILYSNSYMYYDINKFRFLYLMLLFIFSMFFLIISPNMISILLGWDGLGLVSYCLVVYFQNFYSYNAGMLTVLINRLGDVSILMSIAWMFNLGSWYYISYMFVVDFWSYYLVLLLILSGFTSSAQIPFSSWLPAAMAAPTPVSSLVHSSTLVTAGVYLLIRFSDLILMYNCSFFLLLSLLTMFMSGLGANFEYDLKSIIALSTLSQLGLMMSCIFFGLSLMSFFHLLTHAFFKSLLFLCAGLFIHIMSNNQDVRFMGFIINQLPYSSMCFVVCSFSLMGLPFLSGFYSKDLIIEFYSFSFFNIFVYMIYYISIGLTVMYSFRLLFYLMFGFYSIYSFQFYFEDNNMIFSMIFLFFMSIIFGSICYKLMFSVPVYIFIPFFLKIFSYFFIFVGMIFGLLLDFYINKGFVDFVFNFFGTMWFMEKFIYFYSYVSSIFSGLFYFLGDWGWGEYLFSKYMYIYMLFLSNLLNYLYFNSFKIFLASFFFIFFVMIL
nr:NADH dehydrogenase subunit 5 [Hypselosoma matsumurae]